MGPIVLFDKSFLQSLSVDEAVWFDHFFMPVVCPIFFVETLADLTKQPRPGSTRTPQEEVRILADKSPVMSASPCVHHMHLAISNLLGHSAPHLGQVPIAGGRPVRNKEGKPGVVFENLPRPSHSLDGNEANSLRSSEMQRRPGAQCWLASICLRLLKACASWASRPRTANQLMRLMALRLALCIRGQNRKCKLDCCSHF